MATDKSKSIRKQFRFGEEKRINIYICPAESDDELCKTIAKKEEQYKATRQGMIDFIKKQG